MTEREFQEKLKQFDREWKEADPAEEGSYEPLPPGDYEGIVIDAKLTESQGGNVGLNTQFEVTQGEQEGRYIYHTFWVTSKNIPYVKRDMGMLGYSPNSAADLVNAKRHIMNTRVILHVGQEEYEGKMRNKVRGFSKIEDNPRQTETADDKYQF